MFVCLKGRFTSQSIKMIIIFIIIKTIFFNSVYRLQCFFLFHFESSLINDRMYMKTKVKYIFWLRNAQSIRCALFFLVGILNPFWSQFELSQPKYKLHFTLYAAILLDWWLKYIHCIVERANELVCYLKTI